MTVVCAFSPSSMYVPPMMIYNRKRMTSVSEQFLNGTSAHIRLFSAIHSFSAIHGMVDLNKVGYNQNIKSSAVEHW